MRKKAFTQKLVFKKTQISSLASLKGGNDPTIQCVVSLSEIESCSPACNWTDTCLSVHCTVGCGNTGGSGGGSDYTCWSK